MEQYLQKEELNFVWKEGGLLYVTKDGQYKMLRLYVHNLDMEQTVSKLKMNRTHILNEFMHKQKTLLIYIKLIFTSKSL